MAEVQGVAQTRAQYAGRLGSTSLIQARMPPVRFLSRENPAACRSAIALALRIPLLQWTTYRCGRVQLGRDGRAARATGSRSSRRSGRWRSPRGCARPGSWSRRPDPSRALSSIGVISSAVPAAAGVACAAVGERRRTPGSRSARGWSGSGRRSGIAGSCGPSSRGKSFPARHRAAAGRPAASRLAGSA